MKSFAKEESLKEDRLLHCIKTNDLAGIEQCMEAGTFTCFAIRDSDRRETPLHVAAWQGYVEAVEVMTREEYLQDLDSADSRGYSPLGIAVNEGHIEVVSILLERGTNPNGANGWNFPVDTAKRDRRTDIEALLLAAISKRALERDLAKPKTRAKPRDPMNRPAEDLSACLPAPTPARSVRRRL